MNNATQGTQPASRDTENIILLLRRFGSSPFCLYVRTVRTVPNITNDTV